MHKLLYLVRTEADFERVVALAIAGKEKFEQTFVFVGDGHPFFISGIANQFQKSLFAKHGFQIKDIQETLDMSEYINFPNTLNIRFDVVIVDGRKRRECLELASKLLAPDGVAILHDAERKQYHPAFKNFKNGRQFVCENKSPVPGGMQKLWVGRLPPKYKV